MVVCLGLGCVAAVCAAYSPSQVGALKVDYPAFMSRNDVVYLSPPEEGWENLPLGNGRLGAALWQPEGIVLQLNTALSAVYNGAIARVCLNSAPGLLDGLKSYEMRLAPYDAGVTVHLGYEKGEVRVRTFIPADTDAVVMEVEDTRPGVPHRLGLETWRETASTAMDGNRIVVSDKLSCEGEPDYRFALAADMDEATPAEGGVAELETAARKYVVYAAFAQTRDGNTDVVAEAGKQLAALRRKGIKNLRREHCKWWAEFWSKSLVNLSSGDGIAGYVENLWVMHIYAMGAGSRGEVQPKFNGGLWTHDRDNREWGSQYWHWNQQAMTWPIFASNHPDLHRAYHTLYFGMLPAVKKWTREAYGLDGAQFQETIPFHGRMPHWESVTGMHPRVPVPKEFKHTNGILSTSAEIAMQFWWYWLYTGDEAFLREKAYPLMKDVAIFYLGYLEKDDKGRYNMWPSNAHESYWCVKNPLSDMAALRYLFPTVIQATELLGRDADLREQCREVLAHLAPYSMDAKGDFLAPHELEPGKEAKLRHTENIRLFPISIFPLMTLGSQDYELALRTFRRRNCINANGWNNDALAAARLGIADEEASDRLFPDRKPGEDRTRGVEWLLPEHAHAHQVYPCGLGDYAWRQPGPFPYFCSSGPFATAVNEMLLQGWSGVIRVAPALPKNWNAKFTLLAMGGFLVTAECENGKVLYATIESQRGGMARLVNPFGEPAVVFRAGKTVKTISDASTADVIAFETKAGRMYRIVPVSRPDAATDRPVVSGKRNDAPRNLPFKSKRCWIGKPAAE